MNLGFRGHNGFARRRLGQLVNGPLPAELAVDVGQHQGFHKAFDKGGFAGPHRPHHPDVNVAVGPFGDVMIDVAAFHAHTPFLAVAHTRFCRPSWG